MLGDSWQVTVHTSLFKALGSPSQETNFFTPVSIFDHMGTFFFPCKAHTQSQRAPFFTKGILLHIACQC